MSTVKIKGELFWAKWMAEFNTAFNATNNRYECVVGNISDEDCKKLESIGVRLKQKDAQGKYIIGKSQYVFEPKTADGKPVNIEDIGNGTKVEVSLSSYSHPLSSKYGNAPSIKYITVTDLKEYVPEDKEEKKVAVTDLDDDDIL